MLSRSESIFHIEEEERQGERKRVADAGNLKGLQILIDHHSGVGRSSFYRFSDHNDNSVVMNYPSLLSIDGRRRRRHPFAQVQEGELVFLKACFFCQRELSPHKDVYMYRGEQGFCSEACRGHQILLDETRHVDSLTRKIRPLKAAPPPKVQESGRRRRILAAVS